MKILLVDDSSIVRKKFEKLLTHLGYTVIAAESGSAGWEILRKTGDLQLAIVDWEMPQMSGVEMCRIVRESKLGRYIYFVLLTANSGAEYIVKGMQAGADDYLTKSVSEEELAVRLSAGCRIVELHKELEQRSKLESIGTLAAGVAHELNTPIQYLSLIHI